MPGHPYGDPVYWEQRYTRSAGGDFEWFYGYTALRRVIRGLLSRKKLCLNFGCGNSNLQEGMALDKYTVVNTDISPSVIHQMQEKHKHLPNLSYKVSDVTNMPEFCDYHFGSVIDKGTLDALLCCKDSKQVVHAMYKEVSRVLEPGGIFLLVTLGAPEYRLQYIFNEQYKWKIEVYLVPRVPKEELINVEGRPEPINDTRTSLKPLGPFRVNEKGEAVGLPQPWDPSMYFYCYACKKHGLVMPFSKDDKVKLPDSWRMAVKETLEKLKAGNSLPYELLSKGTRRHVMNIKDLQTFTDLKDTSTPSLLSIDHVVSEHCHIHAEQPSVTRQAYMDIYADKLLRSF